VAAALQELGGTLHLVGSNYAVAPGTVRKDDGTPYAVFTPFSRAWARIGWPEPAAVPAVDWLGDPDVACEGYPSVPSSSVDLPPASEDAAHDRLEAFARRAVARYGSERDRPDHDGTSRLSPYLRWGQLHPRQVLAALDGSGGAEKFRLEIAWREFYADVLLHRPASARQNLQRRMDAIELDTDADALERLAAWCDGRTGYPIVDAGMRQLRATGWMHNRVRMIVASFLVKDLHLPWWWGARHFMAHLVDGDLASNSHGWQWAAGTGTDAAPYVRVFNPVLQSRRYDPDGAYVRLWVPELAHVPLAVLHEPWTSAAGLPLGYPPPIVDHAVERQEALRRFAALAAPPVAG
jgi:deoxyribodipyrimidine photo-lyase